MMIEISHNLQNSAYFFAINLIEEANSKLTFNDLSCSHIEPE